MFNVKKLKELMDNDGLSINGLAKAIGVSASMVSYWTRGVYEPKRDSAVKLAEFFSIEVKELYL